MCEHGDTVRVPTPDWLWNERSVPENGIAIDRCIADKITAAWAAGVRTLGSCCGHFKEYHDYHNVVLTGDPEQPELAREHLPGWTLYQWQLVDVSCAVIDEPVPA